MSRCTAHAMIKLGSLTPPILFTNGRNAYFSMSKTPRTFPARHACILKHYKTILALARPTSLSHSACTTSSPVGREFENSVHYFTSRQEIRDFSLIRPPIITINGFSRQSLDSLKNLRAHSRSLSSSP